MVFGRRNKRREDYGTKGKARPKLALVGAIFITPAILFFIFVNGPVDWEILIPVIISGMIGTVMLLSSMSRRNQSRFSKGLDTIGRGINSGLKDQCNCCKCTNCDRYHNHWTHDDRDTSRRHF